MPFSNSVRTSCNWNDLPAQVRNKVNEVADDGGRNSHGAVSLNNGTQCQHWRAGNYRIFGNYQGNTFTFIGYGEHTGRGSGAYTVQVCGGRSTRATTA